MAGSGRCYTSVAWPVLNEISTPFHYEKEEERIASAAMQVAASAHEKQNTF
jgi:hypothetical protein